MSKKLFFILSVLVISMLVFSACAPAAAPVPAEEPAMEEKAPVMEEKAKGPDWWEGLGTEENPIIFVAVPSGETERVLAGFDKMAKMIYANTGIVIEPFVATSYVSAIEAFCQTPPKAHMGALATFAYILASSKGCAETALVSVRNGAAYYNGQFVVRADSGLEKLEDLKGKIWCAPSLTSTSGYIIPSIMFKAVGMDATTDFAGILEGGGAHEVGLTGLYNGDCDFATSYIDARSRIEGEFPDVMEKTTVIEVMPDIPNDGIQFVTDMPVALKGKLVKAILDLFKTEEGKAAMEEAYQWTAMETHGDDFYDQFRQVLDAAGIDPEELAK
jgi:phosphonate transport system substrate-binding protein